MTGRGRNWHGSDTSWRTFHDSHRVFPCVGERWLPDVSPRHYVSVAHGAIARLDSDSDDSGAVAARAAAADANAVDRAREICVLWKPATSSTANRTLIPREGVVVGGRYPASNPQSVDVRRESCPRMQPHFGWREDMENRVTEWRC